MSRARMLVVPLPAEIGVGLVVTGRSARSAIVDDTEQVRKMLGGFTWNTHSNGERYYLMRHEPGTVHGRVYFARELLGKEAVGKEVRYINGNTLDCRRANLEVADPYGTFTRAKEEKKKETLGVTIQIAPDGFRVRWTDEHKVEHTKIVNVARALSFDLAVEKAILLAEQMRYNKRLREAQHPQLIEAKRPRRFEIENTSPASKSASIQNLID